MTSSVTVSYGRKRTDKLGDGSFDAVELGAILTVSDIDDGISPLSIEQSIYEALKAQVDKDFESIPHHEMSVLKAIPAQPAPVRAPAPAQQEEPRADAPPRKPLDWLNAKVEEETANIQQRINALPGEHLSGSGSSAPADDDWGTPPVSSIVPNQAVMYAGCRVFESKVAKASNGNEYCAIRVGARGPDGIPGQYTTARSFDPAIVDKAKSIREGDMVDIYGYFKPWKNDDTKFDLELQKIERSDA